MSRLAVLQRALLVPVKRPLRRLRNTLYLHRQQIRNAIAAYRANRPPFSGLDIACCGSFLMACRKGTPDESVLQHSFDKDIYFAAVPEYDPARHDVILDIGAHIGAFAVLAASKVPHGSVYAIEACEETCRLLQINAALNHLPNLKVSHLALAGRKGTGTLFYDVLEGNWGHTITGGLSRYSETVPMDTLEGYITAHNIERCQLAKLNCEGAEFDILLSSPKAVLERIDRLIILYHCDLKSKASETQLLEHLANCGFSVELRRDTPERGWIIAYNRDISAKGSLA